MVERQITASLAASAALMPKEAMLEVKKQSKHLYIGIPKEISLPPAALSRHVRYCYRRTKKNGRSQMGHYVFLLIAEWKI